jgi:hypothetical protein
VCIPARILKFDKQKDGVKVGENLDDEIRQIVQRVLMQAMGLQSLGLSQSDHDTPPKTSVQPETSPKAEIKPAVRQVVAIGADHGGFEMKEMLKADRATK